MSSSRKLRYRWTGPYKVHQINHKKGNYLLEKLDSAVFNKSITGNRIKSFRARERDSNLPIGQRSTFFRRREEEINSKKEKKKKDIINPNVTYIPEGQRFTVVI